MKKINPILIVLLTFMSFGLDAQDTDKVIDKIVAKVGDRIVLYSDVEIQFQQTIAQGGQATQCSILDNILLERLLVNQAVLDSVDVSDQQVEGELDNRFRYYINLLGSEEAFEEHFKKTVGEFKAEFRPEIRNLLLAQAMQQQVLASVTVTPSEVRSFYNSIPNDSIPYFNAEVEIGQIIINSKVSKAEEDKAKTKLQELKARILSGEDTFESLAEVYSEDPGSGRAGGNLGWTTRGDFVPEFEAAAFKLSNGELSDLVKSQFGYHLIKLLERRGNKIKTQHILIKPKMTSADLGISKNYADSILNVIRTDSLSFADAVNKFCDDEENRKVGGDLLNPYNGDSVLEVDQIEPDYFFVIDELKEGELSEPVLITGQDGTKSYHILKLKSKTAPHQANLETDYDRIQQLTKVNKQKTLLADWIKTKAGKTYIDIDDQYLNCPEISKWKAFN